MVDEGGYSGFRQLIKMLLDKDPRRRPSLHSVVDKESVSWTTNQLLEAFGCQASGNETEETVPGVRARSRQHSQKKSCSSISG
ncbi:hypothetical protein SERLADRAFT_467954 [Serpula lacrymans var. lacrymans S7.9]|nr:uncharacterized protein SERLADRAFT_467954 [Serpula lacrymans var. lacrymans S7.9]EGO24515.1 hypothetical protein SERLADRAFT_467954 [Serpula lacrymans var. lacrymans S7.9]